MRARTLLELKEFLQWLCEDTTFHHTAIEFNWNAFRDEKELGDTVARLLEKVEKEIARMQGKDRQIPSNWTTLKGGKKIKRTKKASLVLIDDQYLTVGEEEIHIKEQEVWIPEHSIYYPYSLRKQGCFQIKNWKLKEIIGTSHAEKIEPF